MQPKEKPPGEDKPDWSKHHPNNPVAADCFKGCA
jgi:hypothetical protein